MVHIILPRLSDSDIETRLAQYLPHWTYADNHLVRVCKTTGWKGTLMVVTTVGHLAEAAWHHPDLSVSYAKLEIRLQSDDAGGITTRDFELAEMIERVVFWQPAKQGLSLEGTPQTQNAGYIIYD